MPRCDCHTPPGLSRRPVRYAVRGEAATVGQGTPMLSLPPWRKIAAGLWNRLPLPFERMAARIDDPGQTDAPVDGPPLNKICDRRDWAHPAWQKALSDLGYSDDPARLHRKEWEFAQGVYGLRTLRCLSPDAAALGLGAGAEPIIYFLAGRLRRVVATDLYAGDFSGQEADPRILRDPEAFAPFSYHRDRLEVRRMDATTIDYGPESFDLVFSFSSFEHFGSRRAQRRCLGEIHRVLRPGGVAVLTTEVILNTWGRHGDYFHLTELLDDMIPAAGFQLAGGNFQFATSRATLAALIQLPHEIERRPHLILRRWRTYFTSAAFFLEKPVAPGTPEARCAVRGDEVPVGLPPLLRARLAAPPAYVTVPRSTIYRITCRIENTGHATWPRSSPDGFGLVRLGAHLVPSDGAPMILDYGRAELPRDLAPGASAEVGLELLAPDRPGRYRVELDMVREGAAWFSSREPSSVEVPLTVT
jgi:SAM-dependent methyltransferase